MRYSLYLLILFSLLFQSCNTEPVSDTLLQTTNIVDDLGRKVIIPSDPKRIVSITPSITELLYTFTDTSKIVGRSIWCDYPVSVKKVAAVNSYPLDIEGITLLQPDIVFAKKGMISLQEIEKLEKLHIPVVVLSFDLLSEIESNVRKLVRYTNGDTLKMNDWFTQLSLAKDTGTLGNTKKCMIVASVSPIYIFGNKTYVSELIELSGGSNIVENTEAAYPTVDVEYVLKSNPQVYIFTSPEQQNLFFDSYPILKKTQGYKNNKLFHIDDSVLSRPGIRLPLLNQTIKSILSK